jgi:hypothetical protein
MCLVYISITFIFIFVGAFFILRKVKPQAYDNPRNNAIAWLVTYVAALILAIGISEMILKWCGWQG